MTVIRAGRRPVDSAKGPFRPGKLRYLAAVLPGSPSVRSPGRLVHGGLASHALHAQAWAESACIGVRDELGDHDRAEPLLLHSAQSGVIPGSRRECRTQDLDLLAGLHATEHLCGVVAQIPRGFTAWAAGSGLLLSVRRRPSPRLADRTSASAPSRRSASRRRG